MTDLACACSGGRCSPYADTVTNLCAHSYYMGVTETTYAGCDLRRVTYQWGESDQVKMFDGAGALVGFRSDDDIPGTCPGTGAAIGPSLAAGTFDPPASCTQPVSRPLCTPPDGGADAAHD